MSRDTIVSLVFLAMMFSLMILFACMAKHNRKKNWHLVHGKYVCSSMEHRMLVVALCELFPCALLAKGISWIIATGLALCLLLLVLPIMRNPRVEVGRDELLVRNVWGKIKVIPYASILKIYSFSFKNNVSIMLSVEGEPRSIQIAMEIYAGLPELLTILMERCPGVISWKELSPELKKWTLENRS